VPFLKVAPDNQRRSEYMLWDIRGYFVSVSDTLHVRDRDQHVINFSEFVEGASNQGIKQHHLKQ